MLLVPLCDAPCRLTARRSVGCRYFVEARHSSACDVDSEVFIAVIRCLRSGSSVGRGHAFHNRHWQRVGVKRICVFLIISFAVDGRIAQVAICHIGAIVHPVNDCGDTSRRNFSSGVLVDINSIFNKCISGSEQIASVVGKFNVAVAVEIACKNIAFFCIFGPRSYHTVFQFQRGAVGVEPDKVHVVLLSLADMHIRASVTVYVIYRQGEFVIIILFRGVFHTDVVRQRDSESSIAFIAGYVNPCSVRLVIYKIDKAVAVDVALRHAQFVAE